MRPPGVISRLLASLSWRLDSRFALSEARGRASERAGLALLRQVIDLLPHAVSVRDEQGRFLLANRAVAARYGLTPFWLEGRTEAELAGLPCRRGPCEDATPDPVPGVEETITDAAGRTRVFSTLRVPFRQSGRRVVLSVSIDITELQRVQATDAASGALETAATG